MTSAVSGFNLTFASGAQLILAASVQLMLAQRRLGLIRRRRRLDRFSIGRGFGHLVLLSASPVTLALLGA